MAASPQFAKGLTGLWKQGWNEIPEVMGSSVMALIGLGMGCLGVYKSVQENNLKRYKDDYIVIRPDDPRVNDIPKPRD